MHAAADQGGAEPDRRRRGGSGRFPATFVLIAINVVVYLIEIATGPAGSTSPGSLIVNHYGLFGPFVPKASGTG